MIVHTLETRSGAPLVPDIWLFFPHRLAISAPLNLQKVSINTIYVEAVVLEQFIVPRRTLGMKQ
jgi:hypothetical protein